MSDNQVVLVGNLTDDPELLVTLGVAVVKFRMAAAARTRDGEGWKGGETSFFRIRVEGQAADAAKSLVRGRHCVVLGHLLTRSWETPEGETHSVLTSEVEADEIIVTASNSSLGERPLFSGSRS